MAAAPSPDGQRVAFTAQGVLWVVPIAGGKATRITGWDMEPTSPVWSPDGSSIAFQNYDAEGNFHIWTVRPNGADLTRITSGPFDDREPAWTPDGRTLVFASDRSQDRQYKLWQVELGSRKYSALTQGAGTESNPVVSPDGTQLAFVSARRIFTQPMGSTEAPKLVGAGVLPVWLPHNPKFQHYHPGAPPQPSRDRRLDRISYPFESTFEPEPLEKYVRTIALKDFRALTDGKLERCLTDGGLAHAGAHDDVEEGTGGL